MTSLHRLISNFEYRLESLTPTSTLEQKKFRRIDPLRLEDQEASGLQRGFFVQWTGSDGDHDVQDGATRCADHTVDLTVVYSPVLTWDNLHQLILSDRNDIIKALRDPSKYVGFDSNNASTEIGLEYRYRTSDSLDIGQEEVWRLIISWRCTMFEVES